MVTVSLAGWYELLTFGYLAWKAARDAEMPEAEEDAYDLLDEAKAIGDTYGVRVQTRLVRARSFGRAIVDEAARRNSEIIVVGADRRNVGGRTAIFSDIVDFTLKHAPCRVMVAAAPPHRA